MAKVKSATEKTAEWAAAKRAAQEATHLAALQPTPDGAEPEPAQAVEEPTQPKKKKPWGEARHAPSRAGDE